MSAAGIAMLFAVALLLIATGLPAWVLLIGVAAAAAATGIAAGEFTLPLLSALSGRLIGLLDNDLLQALPLYVLIGSLLHHLPLAETLLRVGSYAMRRTGAATALAALGLGALLAPMNGSVGASVLVLGRTVLPRLDRAGVARERSAALVCVGSTLGIVIPPSLVLILLADAMMRAHTEAVRITGAATRIVNTQDIFIGALGPAALMLAALAAVAWRQNRTSARPAQPLASPSLGEWLTAIATLALIGGLLAGVTLGYLYAVEAAAAGGAALLLWGLATRTFDRRAWSVVLADTIAVTGALFALLVAATTFTLVVRAFGTDRWIAELLAGLPGGAPVSLAVVLAGLGLCALVLDAFELIFVVVPLVMPPLLAKVGDATWVAVLALQILQLGYVVPPFGYAVLMTHRQLAEAVPSRSLAPGIAAYVLAIAAVLALTLAFPGLVWHRNPSDL